MQNKKYIEYIKEIALRVHIDNYVQKGNIEKNARRRKKRKKISLSAQLNFFKNLIDCFYVRIF